MESLCELIGFVVHMNANFIALNIAISKSEFDFSAYHSYAKVTYDANC